MNDDGIKRGRPSVYTKELAMEICDVIMSTSKGIKVLCAENPHWPNQDTIFRWLKNYPDFSEQYALAKRTQVEVLMDEILEIADDISNDIYINDEGKFVANNAKVNRARLQIDTRKWIACKLAPKVYGNKIETTQTINVNHEEALRMLV